MAHSSPEQVGELVNVTGCCWYTCHPLQGGNSPHQDEALPPPKALADGKWDEGRISSISARSAPSGPLVWQASPGGRTEKPAPRGPTLEGHQEAGREGGRQGTSVAFFLS